MDSERYKAIVDDLIAYAINGDEEAQRRAVDAMLGIPLHDSLTLIGVARNRIVYKSGKGAR